MERSFFRMGLIAVALISLYGCGVLQKITTPEPGALKPKYLVAEFWVWNEKERTNDVMVAVTEPDELLNYGIVRCKYVSAMGTEYIFNVDNRGDNIFYYDYIIGRNVSGMQMGASRRVRFLWPTFLDEVSALKYGSNSETYDGRGFLQTFGGEKELDGRALYWRSFQLRYKTTVIKMNCVVKKAE